MVIRITSDVNLAYGTSQQLTVSMWVKSTWGGTTSVINLNSLNTQITQVAPNKLNFALGGGTGTLNGTVSLNVDPASRGNNVNSGTGYHNIVVLFNNSQATNTITASPAVGANDTVRVYLDGSTGSHSLGNPDSQRGGYVRNF